MIYSESYSRSAIQESQTASGSKAGRPSKDRTGRGRKGQRLVQVEQNVKTPGYGGNGCG